MNSAARNTTEAPAPIAPSHAADNDDAPAVGKVVLAFIAVYVIWGSTYLAIRFAIESLPIFLMPAARFLSAGAGMYAWCRFRGAPKPTWVQWREAFIIGGALLYVANGAVVWAEQYVPSGLAALLVATVPLYMVLMDWWRPGGVRPRSIIFVGLFLGLAGIGILTGPESFAGGRRVHLWGAAALMVASFVWSAGSVYSRSVTKANSPYLWAGMQMIAGGTLHLLTGTILGEWGDLEWSTIDSNSMVALLYLIVFGSIIGFTAYSWLLRVTTPARVATYAYVNPVVAVILGWLIADEELSARTILAAAVIVAAVAFITTARQPNPLPITEGNVETEEPPAALKDLSEEPEKKCPELSASECSV